MVRSARASTKAPSSAASIGSIEPRVFEALGARGDPALEHVRARDSHLLACARDLERDGRDRTRILIIGGAQMLAGAIKEVADSRDQIRRLIEHGRDQLLVERA